MRNENTRLIVLESKRRIAVGLRWMTLPSMTDPKRERSAMAKAQRASHTVLYRHAQQRPVIGIASGLPRQTKAFAAASLFANFASEGSAVLVWDLGDGLVALVGVRDGVPVVDFDLVLTHEGARRRLVDFARLVGDTPRVYGNVVLDAPPTPMTLEALLGQAEVVKAAKLAPATLPVGLIVAALATVATVGVGKYAFDAYQARQAALAAASRPKQERIDPNIAYRAALPAALAGAGLRAEHVADLMTAARSLPLAHQGWWLSVVTCQPAQCMSTWTINGGTFDSFAAAPLTDGRNVQMQSDFKTVLQDFPNASDSTHQGVKEDTLLSREAFQQRVGTMVQRLSPNGPGAQASLGFELTLGAPAILALPQGAAEADIRNPVRFGTWQMRGKLWMAAFPAEFPPGFVVKGVTINVPTNDAAAATITIEGTYFVKN